MTYPASPTKALQAFEKKLSLFSIGELKEESYANYETYLDETFPMS